jgi:hypothetical protein
MTRPERRPTELSHEITELENNVLSGTSTSCATQRVIRSQQDERYVDVGRVFFELLDYRPPTVRLLL